MRTLQQIQREEKVNCSKAMKIQKREAKSSFAEPPCSARALAATIASALFTSSDGARAERLVFRLGSGEDWGGWSEPAAANQIAKIIEAQNDKSSHAGTGRND